MDETIVSNLSAAPAISLSLGSSGASASEDTMPLPLQFQHLSRHQLCLVLHPMKDLRPYLRLLQDLRDYSHEGVVGGSELAAGELVVNEHRK